MSTKHSLSEEGGDRVPCTLRTYSSRAWYPRTGDIVLFSTDTCDIVSRLVSSLTKSEWSHMGVLVAKQDILDADNNIAPPGHFYSDMLLFESVSKLDAPMFDVLTGQMRCGVRAVDSCERLRGMMLNHNRYVMLCHVTPKPPNFEANIKVVAKKFAGYGYTIRPKHIVGLLRKRDDDDDECRVECCKNDDACGSKAFCSMLAAHVFIQAGVLPTTIKPELYSPGDFAPGGMANLESAKLGYTYSTGVLS